MLKIRCLTRQHKTENIVDLCYIGRKMRRVVLFLMLVTTFSCGKSVENQIRDQVRTFDRASLNDRQIEITNVQRLGDHATAEVQITTGVKMVKENGKWVIEEFQIGAQHWEKVEHIATLINQKRSETTLELMNSITEGIERYTKLNLEIPQVSDFGELATILFPNYQNEFTPIDAWAKPFSYRPSGAQQYELRSLGPDGNFGTPDDLVVNVR